MKNCPYCAEQIQDGAIKCRYCREWLDGRSDVQSAQTMTTAAQQPRQPSWSTKFLVLNAVIAGSGDPSSISEACNLDEGTVADSVESLVASEFVRRRAGRLLIGARADFLLAVAEPILKGLSENSGVPHFVDVVPGGRIVDLPEPPSGEGVDYVIAEGPAFEGPTLAYRVRIPVESARAKGLDLPKALSTAAKSLEFWAGCAMPAPGAFDGDDVPDGSRVGEVRGMQPETATVWDGERWLPNQVEYPMVLGGLSTSVTMIAGLGHSGRCLGCGKKAQASELVYRSPTDRVAKNFSIDADGPGVYHVRCWWI